MKGRYRNGVYIGFAASLYSSLFVCVVIVVIVVMTEVVRRNFGHLPITTLSPLSPLCITQSVC